jgi:hypothetical protein
MESASIDQDINCRTVGRCVYGDVIDSEVGDMIPRTGHPDPLKGEEIPLDADYGRQFLYARYNPRIDAVGFKDLGLEGLDPANIEQLDDVEHLDDLLKVGHAYAEKYVKMSPFARFL